MSISEMVLRYAGMARAAGTEVHILRADDLSSHLASLLITLLSDSCNTASSIQHPVDTPVTPARVAAVPASGWPERLLREVREILESAGYEITTPHERSGKIQWDRDMLEKASVGVTFCPAFLAETGSIVMPAGPGMGTLASLLPDVHIAISYAERCRVSLAEYLCEDGFSLPSRLTLVTGPSRTGDIEGTMTTGVHGPRKVLHLIVER
jgi:L-lactate utilization protein LutC